MAASPPGRAPGTGAAGTEPTRGTGGKEDAGGAGVPSSGAPEPCTGWSRGLQDVKRGERNLLQGLGNSVTQGRTGIKGCGSLGAAPPRHHPAPVPLPVPASGKPR